MTTSHITATCGRLIGAVLEGDGVRLPSAVRSCLEARFGASLDHIRLYTGRAATIAARRLDARAFAWGRHIVLGTGEYRPDTDCGIRLLAHEVTHALQQRNEPFPGAGAILGAPGDMFEQEAEAAAGLIASGRNVPPINQGAPPALRRVIIIKAPATTGVDFILAGVKAAVSTNVGAAHDLVSFNLTRNFNSANPPASDNAFRFQGHVGVTFDPGDPTSDFQFGWVQFMRQIDLSVVYAGREDREGQITINPMPLLGTSFMIDRVDAPGAAAFSPFARNPALTSFDAAAKEVVANMDDHPMIFVADRRQNGASGATNFLFRITDIREAVSVFVVRDKFNRFTSLAHVTWDLIYTGTFKWREGQILPVTDFSDFRPKPFVKGAPTDKRIAGLMAKLSPGMSPIFNPTSATALRTASTPGNPNRHETNNYVDAIPALFVLEGRGSLDIP